MINAVPLDEYQRSKGNLLHFLTYAEMEAMPAPEWLVEGVILKRSTALLFGKSNAFKSFIAIDIGMSVASGIRWHGNRTAQGKVCFVATEGANGVGSKRIPAWLEQHGVIERGNTFLYPREICLDVAEQVTAVIETMKSIGGFALVVLDIFGGTMVGSEIEDKTARAWVHGIQRILRETGASVLVVAHTGWQDDTRARMHTHFWGSFDSRMRVEGDKSALTTSLAIERHKDADSAGSWGFKMVEAGESLVPMLDANVKVSKQRSLPTQQRIALDALDDALQAHGVIKTDNVKWPNAKVVALRHWKDHCIKHSFCAAGNDEAVKKAFQRAMTGLTDRKAIRAYEGFVWRCFDD
jgi:hypothetical protein